MNRSRSRKVNRIQSAPVQAERKKGEVTSMQKIRCPYNLEQFETFDNMAKRRTKSGKCPYLVFKRNSRSNNVNARLSLPSTVIEAMHECMDFGDYLEYRISRSASAIALMPGPNGVKLSRPSDKRGDRGSMSMSRAADMLCEMFGNSHYTYLTVEYYDGVVILRPTGETEGTVDPEPAS